MKAKFILILILVDILAIFIGLNFGSSGVGVLDVNSDSMARQIIMDYRLPRTLVAMSVGVALATAGCIMQSLFRNPLADPYILGISSGASAGAALVMVIGIASTVNITIGAFAASVATMFVVYRIGRVKSALPVLTLLLAGVAMAYFLSGVTSLLLYIGARDMHQIVFWVMGGFWTAGWFKFQVIILPVIGCVIYAIYSSWKLNAVLMGEEHAMSVGLNVESFKRKMIVVTALLTSVAVSVSGAIGFVGLVTPHAVRLVVGGDNRVLLPATVLCGAALMPVIDVVSRTATEGEIPVGIITALLGAPFFLFLLRRKKYAFGS
ncbi:MAG: FecCD family ABC transporter permease [Archaeoglobaceae archaeon]